ncbi:hypothetical protein H4Q26_008830 [Puccinia striiformis f. sp. tritici PST-130]|nr:hypothetical protein H4Q26_008830 [Puccinia striiformis f. sp. tritici PST-130]
MNSYRNRLIQSDDHLNLDHNGIGDIPHITRPHLEHEDNLSCSRKCNAERIYRVSMPHVSWPERLPSNPLIPLCLVNRIFQRCAQKELFENVALKIQWQAYLFHRSLTTSPSSQDTSGLTQAVIGAKPEELGTYVRSLQFEFSTGYCSMGKGGGNLMCDIILSCPLLQNIAINTNFLSSCKEPILNALASRRLIKDFVILQNPARTNAAFQWTMEDVIGRLFLKWDLLETVDIIRLSGRPTQSIEAVPKLIPAMNCLLRTIILEEPDLDARELSSIMKSCRETLRTLVICYPSTKLNRTGLCQILKECTSPNLESSKLQVHAMKWHRISSAASINNSDDPAKNRGLLDIVLKSSSAWGKLRSLYISNALAGPDFLNLLPQSIIKLSWRGDNLSISALRKALSGWQENRNHEHSQISPEMGVDEPVEWLPNLKCLCIHGGPSWDQRKESAIKRALKARGVCFHSSYEADHYPTAHDRELVAVEDVERSEDVGDGLYALGELFDPLREQVL